jgi:hypothetical protein
MRMHTLTRLAVAFLLLVLGAGRADAHARGESYVWVNVEETHFAGRIEFRIPDLRAYLGLDIPEDLAAAEAAVDDTMAMVEAYVREHLDFEVDGEPLAFEFVFNEVRTAPGLGNFAAYEFRTPDMAMPATMTVRSRIFFADDPRQRCLICIEYDRIRDIDYGGEFTAVILNPSFPEAVLDFDDVRSLMRLREIGERGFAVWRDPLHALFVVAMLLPVAIRHGGASAAGSAETPSAETPRGIAALLGDARDRLLPFTVAWGLALGATSAGVISMSSAVVTAVVGASVVVIAIGTLLRIGGVAAITLLALLGLFHGVAFADILVALPFRLNDLPRVLVIFAGGLGIGELAIAAVVLAIVAAVHRHPAAARALVTGGSVVCLLAGAALLTLRLTGSV